MGKVNSGVVVGDVDVVQGDVGGVGCLYSVADGPGPGPGGVEVFDQRAAHVVQDHGDVAGAQAGADRPAQGQSVDVGQIHAVVIAAEVDARQLHLVVVGELESEEAVGDVDVRDGVVGAAGPLEHPAITVDQHGPGPGSVEVFD